MVKHIVLFKLKETGNLQEKIGVMQQFKDAIESLPKTISIIRKIEVGININSNEAWDLALYSEFDSLDDVKLYAAHPDHIAAASIIADYKENRSCVDYEY